MILRTTREKVGQRQTIPFKQRPDSLKVGAFALVRLYNTPP